MSTYGTLLKVTSFGESHGKAIGCVIDGFLPNIEINFSLIQKELNRRRPNQSKLTSSRNEEDKLIVLSGFDENRTLGTPITFLINNEDVKKEHYSSFIDIPRPGHGDYTYFKKYNIKNKSGSSRFSGRETATRVAAGACIEQWLQNYYHCSIVCYVHSVGNIKLPEEVVKNFERNPPSRDLVDTYGAVKYDQARGIFCDFFGNVYNADGKFLRGGGVTYERAVPSDGDLENAHERLTDPGEYTLLQTRCPHPFTAVQICSYILKLKEAGDSIGGIATCIVQNVPIGIGEPIFEKMESELGKIILSIPAVKGIEFGSGFDGTYMLGSEHNDLFRPLDASEERYYQRGWSLTNSVDNNGGEVTSRGAHAEEGIFFEKNYCHLRDHTSNRSDTPIEQSMRQTSPPRSEKLLITTSNNCGGILAGITTGNNIVFRAAIKPVSSIQIEKETSNFSGQKCKLKVKGMHDCCILPRLPPIIEACTSIVIGDMILRQVAKYGHSRLPSLGYLSRSTKE
ncbi:chorismate synthase, putative [Plasmodium knowlesi strain H]|uniref:chorismate synthase n=3 Tax=Plasmodium knowlesi TaxID=5850 RepID=A0A5K1VUV6_PLAKH|nr:chorismate synthase, putative [Plasmodium knowlesi strain H]OTN64788.1 putative Chorismate synthase [Plasmodium knowlesi]CAA9989100.1 chorismate synthase, putative [Plasmodium knowlesi strain H]SBO27314.1 chorismate synthase, putative [Plasmodium knowlesi strain H]SBO28939.1 chorismate synthase, putative [Plasmodium knowlesi strain H]VVS78574.1 chorismate synthase, putative [Plasmodium knowlesi strain H]|eukprot:XP_002261447.1 chorismate synthase, putative [Plasmodium knowlesi strain H]